MSKKLYAAFVPLFVAAAVAVAPPAAHAAEVPYWYSCEAESEGKYENSACTKEGTKKEFEWFRINEGTRTKPNLVPVTTKGTLVLHALGNTITCTVKDKGTIWNPAGGGAGEDEVTEFANSACVAKTAVCAVGETLEVTSGVLPWYTKLVAGTPIRDEAFSEAGGVKGGTETKIECNKAGTKTLIDVFTGILSPEVGTNALMFGAGSGELEDPAKNKATVTGTDEVEGPAGARGITVKGPIVVTSSPIQVQFKKVLGEMSLELIITGGELVLEAQKVIDPNYEALDPNKCLGKKFKRCTVKVKLNKVNAPNTTYEAKFKKIAQPFFVIVTN